MSRARHTALPLAAGLAAAGLTLTILAATVGIGGRDRDAPAAPAPSVSTEPAGEGRAVFARMGCGTCHTLAAAGSTGEFGPNLDDRLPAHSAESLKATIVDPPGAGDFSGMPTDFGERLGDAELDALVRFLLGSEAGG